VDDTTEEPWFWSGEDPRTEDEAAFITALRRRADGWERYGLRRDRTQVWMHESPHGGLWLLAHIDLVKDGHIVKTLRLDFDEYGTRGGHSPASLNWDADVPAVEAGVDLRPPEGISVPRSAGSVEELARRAADWFEWHLRRNAEA
jgi:hypothetical protein